MTNLRLESKQRVVQKVDPLTNQVLIEKQAHNPSTAVETFSVPAHPL